jgi:DNA invertase Pin-like site-specific DNA recombinase
MIAAIYARITILKKNSKRKSTEIEEIESNADLQIKIAKEFIARKGWTVGPVWKDDGISGEIFDARRPGFKKMMDCFLDERSAQKRDKVDTLVLYHSDRFGRGTGQAYHLELVAKACGVPIFELRGTGNPPQGRLVLGPDAKARETTMLAVTAGFGKMETEANSERVTSKLHDMWDQGKIVSRPPYAYDKTMKPIEDEAKIVRHIFEMKAQDSNPGYWVIARKLEHDRVPSPRAGKVYKTNKDTGEVRLSKDQWSVSTIRGVLTCRAYIGVQEWKGQERPCTAIIKQSLWDKAQKNIKDSEARITRDKHGKRLMGKAGAGVHLLSPLLMCSECGGHMFAWKSTQGTFYYRCTNYHLHGKTGCKQSRGMPKDAADKEIIRTYSKALALGTITDIIKKMFAEVKTAPRQDPKPIREALAKLSARRDRLVAAIAEGDMALTSDFKKEAAELKAKIEHEQGQLTAAETPITTSLNFETMGKELHTLSRDWLGYLQKNVSTAQQIIRKITPKRIVAFPPATRQSKQWKLRVYADYRKVVAEVFGPEAVAAIFWATAARLQ